MKKINFKSKKMKNNIIIASVTLLTISIFTIIIFNLITESYIKNISNKYELNLNETIAIYEVEKKTNTYILITITFYILFAFIWIFSSYKIEKNEEEKLKQILKNIKKIKNQNYKFMIEEIDKSSFGIFQEEIYQTVIQLQEYSKEIENEQTKLNEYLSDISHQLRTPLLSVTVLTDALLEDDMQLPDKQRQFVYDISHQLDKMRWLVESLLKIAQIENKTILLKKEKIYVKELFNTISKNVEIPLEVRNQKVDMKLKDDTILLGDFKWNVEALTNILKNASEHSKDGATIFISCSENPLYTEIAVRDTGTGIDEKDLPHIFDRFYKGKNSSENSFGIGLSLAKEIIMAQEGEIKVKSKVGEGTTFIVKFLK